MTGEIKLTASEAIGDILEHSQQKIAEVHGAEGGLSVIAGKDEAYVRIWANEVEPHDPAEYAVPAGTLCSIVEALLHHDQLKPLMCADILDEVRCGLEEREEWAEQYRHELLETIPKIGGTSFPARAYRRIRGALGAPRKS